MIFNNFYTVQLLIDKSLRKNTWGINWIKGENWVHNTEFFKSLFQIGLTNPLNVVRHMKKAQLKKTLLLHELVFYILHLQYTHCCKQLLGKLTFHYCTLQYSKL